mgnify:CR=1 FL=1
MARLRITLVDPDPSQRDYFYVYAETLGEFSVSMEWQTDDPAVRFRSSWAQRDSTNNYRVFQQASFISDEWFGDSLRTIDFFLPSRRIAFLSNFYPGWSVKVGSVNEPFYRYLETVHNQQAALNNPYAEPTPVHTNVEGGLGVWGGFTKDSVNFSW